MLFQGIILSGGKFAEIGHDMDWVTPVITHWVVETSRMVRSTEVVPH